MKKETNSTVDLILTVFLGWLGVHQFYRGKTGMGVLYLLTFGLFGVGWIVDIVSGVIKIVSKDASRSPNAYSDAKQNTCNVSPANVQTKHRIDSYASQYLNEYRIMTDSLYIVLHTKKIDTLLMRLELCLQKAQLLLSVSQKDAAMLGHPHLHNDCLSIISEKNNLKDHGFLRYFNEALASASSLKTPNGRKNRYLNLQSQLEKFSDKLSDVSLFSAACEFVSNLIEDPSKANVSFEFNLPELPELLISSTDSWLLTTIVYNTEPTKPVPISDYERLFFSELEKRINAAGIGLTLFYLRRMGSESLRLETNGIQIGDVNLRSEKCSIMYFVDVYNHRHLENVSFETTVEAIPYWVKYAKTVINERNRILNGTD